MLAMRCDVCGKFDVMVKESGGISSIPSGWWTYNYNMNMDVREVMCDECHKAFKDFLAERRQLAKTVAQPAKQEGR
jgi:hypothetical protein